MFNWRKWIKILSIIPVTVLACYENLLYRNNNVKIGDMLVGKILGQTSLNEKQVLVLAVEKLIYLVIFNILYGNLISEDFRYSCVYLFSRLKNRKKWFYKKAFELLAIASIYTLLFLGTGVFICLFSSTHEMDTEAWFTLFILFGMITMLLTVTTLAINLISLRFGNAIAFIAIYSSIVILVYISLRSQAIPLLRKYPLLLSLNPVSGVSYNFMEMPQIIILILIYYLILNVAAFLFGARYINKLDISLSDFENN